jgi:hypothetical protein
VAEDSPNKEIDKALKALLKDITQHPPDIQVKILNSAINWEKTKHGILDKADEFDPDAM